MTEVHFFLFLFRRNRCQIAGVAEVCELVSAIAQRFCELGLTHEEFVILKAMALVNAGKYIFHMLDYDDGSGVLLV